ncbi:MAG TPA: insulinase family protein, partial [Pyrinomonadaceae bacterium]|nr:insulinase family protein [Pyrinomonadaceae bacterium]
MKELIRTAVMVSLIAAASLAAFGQIAQSSTPREDRLLNGLRLLVWSDARSPKVTVKTRIHSGAAFDPLGKEGTMKLLSDIIFPGGTTRDYFRDDLGGDLKVTCTHDYIEIDASGDADKFLQIVETLSQALTNPLIDKETTGRVKSPQLQLLAGLEKDPKYVANAAAAKRLFGSYPYGRPLQGTTESVSAIDFADVLFAKQRFFTADNATIAIVGNVKSDFAFRVVKRLFGGWLKADKKIP